MLTIRFDELGLAPGMRVLDVGAGFGRHVFECARRGADVVALDYAADEVVGTRDTLSAMVAAGEIEAVKAEVVELNKQLALASQNREKEDTEF